MNEKLGASIAGAFCIAIGILKAVSPSLFLEFRKRHPWVNLFGFYSFVFKTKYAKLVVVANGIALILMGSVLFAWSLINY
ncbi:MULTISPECIES: hypothetical protein [Burkholderia]|uniref:hypothetical protein n=1 Tax=Burkholderia TaxID=32008 RepID=UPI00158E8328|nr:MULTISPECIES: hypothetical protein [Burkholderia]